MTHISAGRGTTRCIAALALVWLWISAAVAADLSFPPLTGRVVDDAGILSPSVASRLTQELAAHEQRTGQQIVVATVKSLEGRPIEEYGYQLGRAWGIGQKGKNTGAILLVAPNERKVRIEVGYGLEGDLTDAICATIINQAILPRFRLHDMPGGVVAGAEQILRVLGDDLTAPAGPPPAGEGERGEQIGSIILTFFIFGLFVWFAGRRRGGTGLGILPFFIAGSWSSRGGGGSSFGGGGGGFSGGGGSFGGGGASGSW